MYACMSGLRGWDDADAFGAKALSVCVSCMSVCMTARERERERKVEGWQEREREIGKHISIPCSLCSVYP